MKRLLPAELAGILLVCLGGTVMLGWWLQFPDLVRVLPGFAPMVFNTALSFVLAGGALLMPLSDAGNHRRVTTAVGGVLVILAMLVLAEHLSQSAFFIDWPGSHAWLRDGTLKPGQMSVAVACGFLMCGAALILATRVGRPWMGSVVRLLTLGVGAIGVLGLAGYFLNAQLLFPDYIFARVALHTTIGMLVLAVGLWSAWKRFAWAQAPLFARDDDRITFAGAAILGAIALAAGIASFAVLQNRVQTVVGDNVHAAQRRLTEVFQELIELREGNARIAATRPAVLNNLRVIRAGNDDGSNIANIHAVVDSFLKQGFSGLVYYDSAGKIVASGGVLVQTPAMAVPLATPGKAELLWNNGFLLRHRMPLGDARGEIGTLHMEQPLSVLTRLAHNALGMGVTEDMGLCVLRGEGMQCFPQRLNPQAFIAPLVNVAGVTLPMTRALRGETGVVITQDYRAQNVVAAYGPIGNLGMGMVIKIDTTEVFQPIREQLQIVIGLLFLLVAGGTILLRSQVQPLATRLVDTEAQARSQEQRFKGLLDSAPAAMVMTDKAGRIVLVNAQTEALFGYTRDKLLGQMVEMLVPQRFRGGHPAHREGFFASPRVRPVGSGRDFYGLRKDGSEFPAEIGLNPIETAEGLFVLSAIIDITERKQALDKIKRLNEMLELRAAQLETSNKELESFSYSVSHDLRAPLRAIDGFSRIVLEDHADKLDDNGRRQLNVIRDNSRKMGRLIDDLLEFSRLGRKSLSSATIDMKRMVEEAFSALQMPGARSPRLAVGTLPPARGDVMLVKQAWANLLGNAIKFSSKREHPVIEVSGSENDVETVYCVKDNGAGFDMQYYDKLFGVFQRLHTDHEFPGTGVGLAIVQRAVSRHGGRVWATGMVGEGAAFYFSLPKEKPDGQV